MKKIIYTMLVAAAGMMTSFAATAAGTAIVSGTAIPNDATGCELLSEPVTLNLSKNVFGGYQCDLILNSIKVAACHKAGSRKATTLTCQVTGTNADGSSQWNDTSCAATTDTFDIADFRAFVASSTGGSVAPAVLGGACADGTVTALGHFN